MFTRYAPIAVAVVGLAAFAPGASADPLKNSLVFPADCGGTSVEVAVHGGGEFTPAHVLGSTAIFVPEAFDLTSEFTPTGGTAQTQTDTGSKPNVHGDLVTCSFDTTQEVPGGTLHLFGSATGFFTPASS